MARTRGKLTGLVVGVVFLISLWAAPAMAETTLVMGTGSAGSPYHLFGQMLAEMVNQSSAKTGIRIKVVASIGSVDNINGLLSGRFQLALSQADVEHMAWNGLGPWSKAGKQKSLRNVYDVYTEGLVCVASQSSKIRVCKDLLGKRVALGAKGSGTLVNALQALSLCYLKPSDLGQALYVDPGQAMRLMYEGKLDAFFYMVGHPNQRLRKFLRAYQKGVMVPFKPSQAMLNDIPYYVGFFIWKNDYPSLRNSQSSIKSFGIETLLVTTDRVPKNIIYEVSRIFLMKLDEFKKRLPFMSTAEPPTKSNIKMHAWNVSAPYHDGMVMLLQEMGLVARSSSPKK